MDLKQTLENYIDNQKRKHLDCEMCGKRYSNKGSLREVFKSNMINIGEGLMFHLGKVQWGGWWTFSTRSPDLKVHKKILEPPRLTILPELEIEPRNATIFCCWYNQVWIEDFPNKGTTECIFTRGRKEEGARWCLIVKYVIKHLLAKVIF